MSTKINQFGCRTRRVVLAAVVLCMGWGAACAEMRTWRTRDGRIFEAAYQREAFGSAFFKDADKKSITVDFENLSASDQKYIRSVVPPEFTVDFSRKTHEKPRPEMWKYAVYQNTDNNNITVDAEVVFEKKGKAPYDGTLTAELYLFGAEQATSAYRVFGKDVAKVRFTEENEGEYTMEYSADVRYYLEYNKVWRGAKYCGYAVVVLGPDKKLLHFESNLRWLTEDKVEALRQLKLDDFLNERCKKISTPRPQYYEARVIWR